MPFGPQLPIEELRARARGMIARGELPGRCTMFVDAEFGTGEHGCDLCGQPIAHRQVQYEIALPSPNDRMLHFHWRAMQLGDSNAPRRRGEGPRE